MFAALVGVVLNIGAPPRGNGGMGLARASEFWDASFFRFSSPAAFSEETDEFQSAHTQAHHSGDSCDQWSLIGRFCSSALCW